jgi:2-hydroxy-6-oxonona-2,4-dienedioate hydrolase
MAHGPRLIVPTVLAALPCLALALFVFAQIETRERTALLERERSLSETRHGRIEFMRWGEGPPVLVIHGAGGGFDQGRLLARTFGESGFGWIAVSRFGYLGSAMPKNASTAAQAEAFSDLLDALGVERVRILAMSGGVPPSLKFAEMFPERVDRMMLLSSAPFAPFDPIGEDRPIPTWAYSVLLGSDAVYWTLAKTARRSLERAFDARDDLTDGATEAEKRFVGDLVVSFLPASRRVDGVNNEAAAIDRASTYDLERIRAGVLVVHARDDRLNPIAVSQTIAARIPGSRFLALEQGGHLLLGHHSELRRAFATFMAE